MPGLRRGLAALMILIVPAMARGDDPIPADWVIENGTIIDGTGRPRFAGDLAIRGNRIVAIGTFARDPKAKRIDARGKVISPGFIDLHTHSDDGITRPKLKVNANYLTQGVTTIVTGNCGGGAADVAAYFHAVEEAGVGSNVIHLIPQGTIRGQIVGSSDRRPTRAELAKLEQRVDHEMRAGAWGISTGLIYVPSQYAHTDELIALAKVVARHGGIYASHIRNEEDGLLGAVEEALTIGREANIPVHISHLKANGEANWGRPALVACEKIESERSRGGRVTADQYPYPASSTTLAAMVVPHWARQGNAADFTRIASDPARAGSLREEIQKSLDERRGGASIRLARFASKPAWVGQDLVTIARAEGVTPLDVVLEVERQGGAQAISFGMSESDVRQIMAHDWVATASDGSTHISGSGDRPHPRAYGTFPRKIRYALDDKVLTLEQAIRSCSGLPAEILGLADRGTIRVGAYADLVIFDPATFRDAATFDDPTRTAPGLSYLFVNGVPTIENGTLHANRLAGRVLRPRTDGAAPLIVTAKTVWTGDPANPRAEAVAIRDGEVVFAGSKAEAQRYKGPITRVRDFPEALVTPGLVDAHAHLPELGAEREQVDLRGVDSPEKAAAKVAEAVEKTPGDGWILGRNWDQSLWPGGAFPEAYTLDKVAKGRPVWLIRVDGHAGWANSEALKRAGITPESRPPAGGQIIRDADGKPTGTLIDAAMTSVWKSVPPPSKEAIARRMLAAQAICFENGLTGVHDASVSIEEAEVFRALDKKGALKLRVYGICLPPAGTEVAFASTPPIPRKPERRFEMRAIKVFIDGAMGSRGALLFEPYADDPKNSGLQLTDPKALEALTTAALRHGWQVCTHAIGDKGNALVLDSFSAALAAVPEAHDPRLRIEHAQVVRREDVPRFKKLGLIASMQPSHSSDDMRWADLRLGPERVAGAYAWRWFLDASVPLAFGSDFPVEVVDPFWGIFAAVTRQDRAGKPENGWHPDQKLTLDETLRGFTAGSAYAGFSEGRLGRLKAGYRADLTVIDRDLTALPPEEILKARVRATIVEGEIVFDR